MGFGDVRFGDFANLPILNLQDGTAETVRRYLPRLGERLHLIRHETNQGVGGAIATGYEWCRDHEVDVAVVMAGDAQMAPAGLPALLDPVVSGEVDYAKGNCLFTGDAWKRYEMDMTSANIKDARQHYHERETQRRARRETERQRWLQCVREVVSRLARRYPEMRRAYLFGSLVQPGRFRPDSDIDIAVECDTLEVESAFWRALERELERDVDVRPLTGAVAEAVANRGELVYGRQDTHFGE